MQDVLSSCDNSCDLSFLCAFWKHREADGGELDCHLLNGERSLRAASWQIVCAWISV